MKKQENRLTPMQKLFVEYYIETGNMTAAVKKAGYSPNGAKQTASMLLKKEHVKEYLNEKMDELSSPVIANAQEVLEYLTRALRGEITEEVIITEGVGNGISEARSVRKEISIKDRNKAAELLGKRYRLFTEKIELDSNVQVTIIDDVGAE